MDPTLLSPFYANDASFDGLARLSVAQLKLLMDWGPEQGYLPDPDKSLFTADNREVEEAVMRKFDQSGLNFKYVGEKQYLAAYLGPREEIEEWMRPKVEAWSHGVRTIAKISKRYNQSAYAGLGMSIHIKLQYLQRTVPALGTMMGTIEYALRDALFPALFGVEEVRAELREIPGHSMKHGGLGIPDPRLSAEHVYNTTKAASEALVGSLLGGTNLNYVDNKDYICISISEAWKQQEYLEIEVLTRKMDLPDRLLLNQFWLATENRT